MVCFTGQRICQAGIEQSTKTISGDDDKGASGQGKTTGVGSVLLRKIALPYPHKCLFGFVEQKRIDGQEFFKEYSCHKR